MAWRRDDASEISGLDLQRRAGNRRDVVVWSSHNKERPAFELDRGAHRYRAPFSGGGQYVVPQFIKGIAYHPTGHSGKMTGRSE